MLTRKRQNNVFRGLREFLAESFLGS